MNDEEDDTCKEEKYYTLTQVHQLCVCECVCVFGERERERVCEGVSGMPQALGVGMQGL